MRIHVLHIDLSEFGERIRLSQGPEKPLLRADIVVLRRVGVIVRNREEEVAAWHSMWFLFQKVCILRVYLFIGRVRVGQNHLRVCLGLRTQFMVHHLVDFVQPSTRVSGEGMVCHELRSALAAKLTRQYSTHESESCGWSWRSFGDKMK